MRKVERKGKGETNEKKKMSLPTSTSQILKLGKASDFRKELCRMLKVNSYTYLDHCL